MKNLKVLIVSEHASNTFGGEAVLPLNYFMMLSQRDIDTYLITHERVRKNLESIDTINQDRIIYIPDTAVHKFLYKIGSFLPDRSPTPIRLVPAPLSGIAWELHPTTDWCDRTARRNLPRSPCPTCKCSRPTNNCSGDRTTRTYACPTEA